MVKGFIKVNINATQAIHLTSGNVLLVRHVATLRWVRHMTVCISMC